MIYWPTSGMSEQRNDRVIPAQTSPGWTRSASVVRKPGQTDEKWATGTKHSWTRAENRELLECYYTSNPKERGYMQRMWDHWILRHPQSSLTKKQLLAQCSNICNRNLLSQTRDWWNTTTMLRQGGARTAGQRGDVIIIPTTRDWVPSPNRYQQPQHKSCWPEKEDRDPTRNLEPPKNTEAELPSTFRRSTSGCECCSEDNPHRNHH